MIVKSAIEKFDIKHQIENAEKIRHQRCLIVALFSMKEKDIERHLENVESIINSNGGIVVGKLVQRRGVSRAKKPGGVKKLDSPLNSSTFIGKGKVEELLLEKEKWRNW